MDRRRLRAWFSGEGQQALALRHHDAAALGEILLGEARTTQNMRDLDIRILTPLSYIDGLLDGHRSLLESLTLPTECFLLDSKLHSRHRAFRPSVDHQQCRQDGFG